MANYPDYTKIYSVIKSFDDDLRLQKDLDYLMQWSCFWLLKFNANWQPPILHLLNYGWFYFPSNCGGHTVFSEVKDPEIWCTGNLKSSFQCQKQQQMLGLIRRSFKIIPLDMLISLYKMYVRPCTSQILYTSVMSLLCQRYRCS